MSGSETPEPLLKPGQDYRSVSETVGGVPLAATHPTQWAYAMAVGLCGVLIFFFAVTWLLARGVGIWGIQIPVAWGFAIINFVWWIGIGHAGTFISAFLLLMSQGWRNSINRFAEAMTLFAVVCAGLFPLMHLGRPWLFYWLFPYPDTMGLWPQFRSPLVWDVFAVSTYFTVSLIFWYVGLLPDLATMRDMAPRRGGKLLYGALALGWRNSATHWHRHQMLYLLLGGIATPLVISVHSVVSLDFAVAQLPGWHTTIFPPYFVAGALYSGFAMVLTIVIPVRKLYGLEGLITTRHLNAMACVMLLVGLIVAYGYFAETLTAWYSGERPELFLLGNRAFGSYGWAYWLVLLCNVLLPQALWWKWVRTNPLPLFVVSIIINVGMWLERFMIVVGSLSKDFLPSNWGHFTPTIWDWATFLGTIAIFLTLMGLFIRLVPMISISEIREMLHEETTNRVVHAAPCVGRTSSGGAAQGTASPASQNSETVSPPRAPNMSVLYGLTAAFDTPEALLETARAARAAGYEPLEAHTPFPVRGLAQALGRRGTGIAPIMLAGAVIGGGGAYLMQYYALAIDYPYIVAGRPLNSWPAFVPIVFELSVLGAAIFGLLGMLFLNRLPELHHPVFNAPGFERASMDRFFLVLEAVPGFEPETARSFLVRHGGMEISEVYR